MSTRARGGESVTAVLQASEAGYAYRARLRPAVDGVSIAIRASEAVGIVGESGCGKSTLGRLLVGVLNPTAGAVTVRGRPWSAIDRKDSCRRRVQMVFQDPFGALNPWQSPIDSVAEVIRVWDRVAGREAMRRAELLLAEVGMVEDATRRRPRSLSGGQCQRVGIARALAAGPEVLVADEPTSSLDVSVQAQILNLLSELRRRRGLALVLISHDLSVVRYATDRALVMYGGQIVEEGPTDELLDSPAHPYTRVLVDAIPGREGPADTVSNEVSRRGGCVFAPKCPHLRDACLSGRPILRGRAARRVGCVLAEEPDSAVLGMERGVKK
jgi:oligopeptide/dipeptide ABC transporter ATP-binding protein